VPTFLIFDGQGELIGRQVGYPNRSEIKALVTGSWRSSVPRPQGARSS